MSSAPFLQFDSTAVSKKRTREHKSGNKVSNDHVAYDESLLDPVSLKNYISTKALFDRIIMERTPSVYHEYYQEPFAFLTKVTFDFKGFVSSPKDEKGDRKYNNNTPFWRFEFKVGETKSIPSLSKVAKELHYHHTKTTSKSYSGKRELFYLTTRNGYQRWDKGIFSHDINQLKVHLSDSDDNYPQFTTATSSDEERPLKRVKVSDTRVTRNEGNNLYSIGELNKIICVIENGNTMVQCVDDDAASISDAVVVEQKVYDTTVRVTKNAEYKLAEKGFQALLLNCYGGEPEVRVGGGFSDVVNHDTKTIMESKHVSRFDDVPGQLGRYCFETGLAGYRKVACLFGAEKMPRGYDEAKLRRYFSQYDIHLILSTWDADEKKKEQIKEEESE
jgi:hypothetical protein